MRKRSLTKRRKHRRHIKNRRNKTRIKKSKTKTKKRKKKSRKKRPKYIKNVLKGGSISCLCAEEAHEDTIKKMLEGMCTESCPCHHDMGGGSHEGGDEVVVWYIVGHGAWKQKLGEDKKEGARVGILEGM